MKHMIVTAYFKIPSKQSHEFYKPHIARFLGFIETAIIFCTTPDLVEWIKSLRPKHLPPLKFILYNSIYEIESFKKYGVEFWEFQYSIDPSKCHTKELSALWSNKKDFVLRAIEETRLEEPYIWADVGCARDDCVNESLKNFGKNIRVIPANKILIQLLNPHVPQKKFFTLPDVYVAGAIMAAYKDGWSAYKEEYEKTVAEYIQGTICADSDQYITASTLVRCPDIFEYVVYDVNLHPRIDEWFFFLNYL